MSLRAFFNDMFLGGACYVKTGSATPEASVTAGVGSLYLRTTSGSPTLYTKATGTGNTGWEEAGLVRKSTSTLTDAQVKALPTTPVTLIAAPAAGYRIKVIGASLTTDFSAGAYTNIDATYSAIAIYWLGDFTQWATLGVADDSGASLTRLTTLLAATDTCVDLPPYADVFSSGWAVPNVHPIAGATALAIAADNDGTGDYTGGNAANTLRVTTYYVVEAVS